MIKLAHWTCGQWFVQYEFWIIRTYSSYQTLWLPIFIKSVDDCPLAVCRWRKLARQAFEWDLFLSFVPLSFLLPYISSSSPFLLGQAWILLSLSCVVSGEGSIYFVWIVSMTHYYICFFIAIESCGHLMATYCAQ